MEVFLLSRFSKVVDLDGHGVKSVSGIMVFGIDGGKLRDKLVIISNN